MNNPSPLDQLKPEERTQFKIDVIVLDAQHKIYRTIGIKSEQHRQRLDNFIRTIVLDENANFISYFDTEGILCTDFYDTYSTDEIYLYLAMYYLFFKNKTIMPNNHPK